MVLVLHKFTHYLLGNKFVFYVYHMAQVYLVNKPHVLGKITKWLLLLLKYDFIVMYKLSKIHVIADVTRPQVPCVTLKGSKELDLRNWLESWCRSQLPALKGVEGSCWKFRDQTRKRSSYLVMNLHPNQHKLVKTHSACIWCWDKPRANSNSHDTPRPGLGRCHHHIPNSILCIHPQEWHPNGSFSQDSQSGVPKLSRFRLPRLWDFVAPRPYLRSG